MQITRNTLETGVGPEDWFTGTVYIDAVATAAEPQRRGGPVEEIRPGDRVYFEP